MSWIDDELSKSKFSDKRLGKRLIKLIRQLADKMGNSIPTACQDWANTKAAYRLFFQPQSVRRGDYARPFSGNKISS